jgi:hypothetical protein
MNRRLPALVVVFMMLAAVVIVARSTPTTSSAVFSQVTAGWMPTAPTLSGLTSSWFCPGVPATDEEGVGGSVLIGNRSDQAVNARIEWLAPDGGDTVGENVTVEASSTLELDVTDRRQGSFVSAVVEVEGNGVVVEQRAVHPAGTAVSPCADSTSDEWYFAEGFTVGGSVNKLVLTNPFDDVVIVDIGFATAEGSRVPAAYQGLPIAPRSVKVIDLGAPGAGAQGEDRLAVRIEATRGRLVVARSQHFLAGNRAGFTMSLGSPALRDQWWFADGEKGAGVTEKFSIYNPTTADVEVDAIFLGITEIADVEPILVPARQVVAFDPGQVSTLSEGRHATVFSTRSDPSIVVERVLTRTVDGRPTASVLLGGTPRPDGYVASTWHLTAGPRVPSSSALVIYNVDNAAGTISVESIGPDGPELVPGLEAVELNPASIRTIDLVDPSIIGRQLIVTSTTRVFVERSLFSESGGGRSSSWALPGR